MLGNPQIWQPCSGQSFSGEYLKLFSDTTTLNLSRHYPEELYVRMQMSEPDIKLILPCQQSLCNVRLSPRVNRAGHCLENSEQAIGHVNTPYHIHETGERQSNLLPFIFNESGQFTVIRDKWPLQGQPGRVKIGQVYFGKY